VKRASVLFGVLAVVFAVFSVRLRVHSGGVYGGLSELVCNTVAAAQLVPALGIVWALTGVRRRALWWAWAGVSGLILMLGVLTTTGFLS
jgi:hypothetical protein